MLLRAIKIHRFSIAIVCIIAVVLLYYLYHINSLDRFRNVYKVGVHARSNQVYVDLRELLMGAIQATQSGGWEVTTIARENDLLVLSKGKTDEGANDPITMADQRSHCIMKHGLQRLFPTITIYSEEDKEKCTRSNYTLDYDGALVKAISNAPNKLVLASDVTVWLDPLDATQEYTEHLHEYVTTMACVAINGVPEIGVIHRPFTGQTAWVWVDNIASGYLEYIRISRQPQRAIEHPIVAVSRSHPGNAKLVAQDSFGPETKILTAAGAGYKVLQVVTNNASLYLHTTKIKKWDLCAGHAILRQFGGNMITLKNQSIDYGSGTNPINTDGVLASINNQDYYISKIMQYASKHKGIIR